MTRDTGRVLCEASVVHRGVLGRPPTSALSDRLAVPELE